MSLVVVMRLVRGDSNRGSPAANTEEDVTMSHVVLSVVNQGEMP